MKKFLMVLFLAGLLPAAIAAAESEASFSGSGRAILGISPDTKEITVIALTADDSAIQVEGCTVTELPSGEVTKLTATGNTIILKGAITELDCSDNRLTSLDVQGLSALDKLYCYNNRLTSLDMHGLTALRELSCSFNQLVSLNVQDSAGLEKLFCAENQLTAFDMRGLTVLQELNCSDNRLTSLDAHDSTFLRFLLCKSNQLTSLNVQGLTALVYLNCRSNRLTSLNVQGLTSLRALSCSENRLTALNIQETPALQKLSCYGNQLKVKALIRIFNSLRGTDLKKENAGEVLVQSEMDNSHEGNITDFSSSAELKTAFEAAKAKNWIFYKRDTNGNDKKI
ncbi:MULTISPECIES: leucine-rich repeat domain-containing protein [unclassified Treponema]|uniref:leucine-rich repeat domain-containing protein n=1 Tax=unclassified Treponema TaxID=2638727 RepID=UPI0020A427F0|nr:MULTISPECIES: hypothetical protein [unclassified Treponema]UTC66541.1 leucine-rich repeat domain-containing protein [Treponema sp. OMZ 789]UTC69273.1 leucine-rich repeat domain-containing protein [Treponema sp. OMZ 790]UTC71987.1 leucine-rich repeat domain-containing protein [Treponema sp. OMZ 791]